MYAIICINNIKCDWNGIQVRLKDVIRSLAGYKKELSDVRNVIKDKSASFVGFPAPLHMEHICIILVKHEQYNK